MVRRIETERLILRTVTADDAEAVFVWASDPEVNKYILISRQNYTQHDIKKHLRAA
ncbi:MAG: GNAT family N-acetyltransferase [Lachnospiraceae bacterium]|nr:GNAT family N-acetyltransferase [Lachnospiraceae bacterium]